MRCRHVVLYTRQLKLHQAGYSLCYTLFALAQFKPHETAYTVPRRPRRNRTGRHQNVNFTRPPARQPQPNADKIICRSCEAHCQLVQRRPAHLAYSAYRIALIRLERGIKNAALAARRGRWDVIAEGDGSRATDRIARTRHVRTLYICIYLL